LLGDLEAAQSGDCADWLHAGKVDDREDSVFLRVGNFYAANARMRERTSYKCDVLHSGEAEISDELTAAAQEALVFLAGKARTDALRFLRNDGRL